MKTSPIYIVENQIYRFEQIIDGMIELFNGHLDKSVMIFTTEIEEIETEIKKHNYTIIQN